jgi:hypothetical protein
MLGGLPRRGIWLANSAWILASVSSVPPRLAYRDDRDLPATSFLDALSERTQRAGGAHRRVRGLAVHVPGGGRALL